MQSNKYEIYKIFKCFSGKSDTGVIKLTQSMGGGKTRNMLALALLTQNKNVEVEFEYKTVLFSTSAVFNQWVEINKLDASELERKGITMQ